MEQLIDRVQTAGHGLTGIGVCTADPFPKVQEEIERRVAGGLNGSLGFTYSDAATATDIRTSFPWAERVIVGTWSYLPRAGTPGPPRAGTGRIARFATRDHYRELGGRLRAIAGLLQGEGYRAEVLADDSRLVDRAVAERAGVGWWGKNSMVLAPGAGPWLLIGSVVTDAPLPTSNRQDRTCGACSACLPACPTGALVAPGVLDARLCLAAVLQAPGPIPIGLRSAVGDRVYGCDDCLEACPPGSRMLESSTIPAGRVELAGVLGAADRALLSRFDHWYVPRRQARHIRRNALVALGNSGDGGAVAIVAGYLGHPDWLLRAHAAWALGRLGGPFAAAALAAGAVRERDDLVVAEIAAARSSLG